MTTTMLQPPLQLTPCRSAPDYWTEAGNDPGLKSLCRACPRRPVCAREALATPGVSGIWAGIYLPPDDAGPRPRVPRRRARSRAHDYAVMRLRVIAAMDTPS